MHDEDGVVSYVPLVKGHKRKGDEIYFVVLGFVEHDCNEKASHEARCTSSECNVMQTW